MFGLGRKTIKPSEFGEAAMRMSSEFFSLDSARSLGSPLGLLPEAGDWAAALERAGVGLEDQKLYFRLFAHSAFQAACLHVEEKVRKSIVHGAAIKAFIIAPSGYDFDQEFIALESVYRGTFKFGPRMQKLSLRINDSESSTRNAQYLIDRFIVAHVPNSDAFENGFDRYAVIVNNATNMAAKAMTVLSRSVKF